MRGRGGVVMEFGIDMYTWLYLKWIPNKDLLYSTGNSAQCDEAAWMGGEVGGGRGMDTWIHMAELLCCAPETLTTLLIGYIPIKNKKLKKKIPFTDFTDDPCLCISQGSKSSKHKRLSRDALCAPAGLPFTFCADSFSPSFSLFLCTSVGYRLHFFSFQPF